MSWCEQLAKCVSAEQDKTLDWWEKMEIGYFLAKYLHVKRLSPSHFVPLIMSFLNSFNLQHFLSPAEVTHLIYLSRTLIGLVFKLPSFPLILKQVTEPGSKRHASNF
jgi:hypothetical protein